MAHNSLSPAFVKIRYVSAYGEHIMTVPSVPIDEVAAGGSPVSFDLRGGALNVGVEPAVTDFVEQIAHWFPSTVTFVDCTAFVQPDPDGVATPIFSFALDISGDASPAGWTKASQLTWTFRADDFSLFKIVLLDAASFDTWDKVTVVGGSGAAFDLVEYVTADVTWIASRGGGRPTTFLQVAKTLNEKLRRAYNMN